MADPIIDRHFRVQAVFQGISGLPEDRYVNNWAFRNPSTTQSLEELGGAIVRVLDAFYFEAAATAATVAGQLSSQIDPAQVEYRIYDLGQAPPRDPMVRVPAAAVTFNAGTNVLPQEVAVCLSLVLADTGQTGDMNVATQQPVTKPIPRRSRVGRMYIGPLMQAAIALESGRPVVHGLIRDTLIDRANNVLNTTENVDWCVISQTQLAAVDVTGGYVDDAFDTQRRRGRAPISRTPFGSYLAPV